MYRLIISECETCGPAVYICDSEAMANAFIERLKAIAHEGCTAKYTVEKSG